MGEPGENNDNLAQPPDNQSDVKIAISKKSLEDLVKGIVAAPENDWQINLSAENTLPKVLKLAVQKYSAAFKDLMQQKDQQISSLSQANVRVLFLNEAIGQINDITSESYHNGTAHSQYESVLDDMMHATMASISALIFIDSQSKISEFYSQGIDKVSDNPTDDYVGLIGLIASKFIENENQSILINEPDEFTNVIQSSFDGLDISNLLLLPLTLHSSKQVRGVLVIGNKRKNLDFDNNDRTVIELCASEISNAYERIILNRQLRREKEEQERLLEEIKYTQDQLLQSEKMASIGQLAAGVAHEINNPVGYINSNINSMKNYINEIFDLIEEYKSIEADLPEEKRKAIEQIRKDADLDYLKEDTIELVSESIEGVTRVKQIVNDLKNFSRVDEAEWQWVNLHEGIDSTLNIVHNEIKYKAEVHKNYSDIPDVHCIVSQINQVVMNLLVNAAHAIEERGNITISTGVDGDMVFIKISDDGCGIEDEKLSRIFDPFYTSKPVGEGTGLGLSLSFGIIEKHKGKIDVKSEVGKGTEFTILLPIKE